MKRLLAAAVTAAALIPAVPAQAAVDPVTALKRQFAPGHGVTISETARIESKRPRDDEVTRMAGSVEFGASGPVAADVVFRTIGKDDSRQRWISVGGKVYVQAADLADVLPMGRTWVLMEHLKGKVITSAQPVDVLAPRTVKALVSHAGLKDGLRQGTLTLAQARGAGAYEGFHYRLGLNAQALPDRVVTGQNLTPGSRSVVETRLSGWGAKVGVKAPPVDEIITYKDLMAEKRARAEKLRQAIPDGSTSSLGLFD
ncbi:MULTISPECIES: hypothetical protein [unclassified Nonomuraea]|uniref:hypothetical protein n=1 Tax=unclassified Nonomuraea TaxID=2593643 RepID=UPI0033CD10D9